MIETPYSDLILVVDDSPESLNMLNSTLEVAGMTTLVALEGSQGISIAKKMVPDLILLDAVMPEMSGFETCQRLKQIPELSNTPVIFMTGLTDTESIVKAFEAGGTDYLTKPINTIELIARIKVHLANARTTLSVQTALDRSGQTIVASNLTGDILWATPEAHAMLGQDYHASDIDVLLKHKLTQWLSHSPTVDSSIKLQTNKGALTLTYAGKSTKNEYLLRLSNDNQASETDLLKSHFNITSREAEVMLWVAKGKTNREIGQILELSPRTINKHLEQLFRKIGVENRTSAAAKAVHLLQPQNR